MTLTSEDYVLPTVKTEPSQLTPDISTDNLVLRPVRMEEHGYVRPLRPTSFYLIFQSAPVWLFALPITTIKYVYIHGCTSLSSFGSLLDERKIDKRLYTSTINSIGRRRFIFTPAPPDVLTLVSGEIPFLNEKSSLIRKRKVIFIVDRHLLMLSLIHI